MGARLVAGVGGVEIRENRKENGGRREKYKKKTKKKGRGGGGSTMDGTPMDMAMRRRGGDQWVVCGGPNTDGKYWE